MSDSVSADPAGVQIDITDFSLDRLSALKKQLEEELDLVTNNLANLKVATTKFDHAGEAVKAMSEKKAGAEILVPLTSSVYVPGEISNADKVLIDIGTGYFVSYSLAQAQDYIKRKKELLSENVVQIYEVMQKKRQSIETVAIVMNEKILKMQAANANKLAGLKVPSS